MQGRQIAALFLKENSTYMEGNGMSYQTGYKPGIKESVKKGISFGSALAMVISYSTWQSVGWAIFHGLLSWAYVLYFLIRY